MLEPFSELSLGTVSDTHLIRAVASHETAVDFHINIPFPQKTNPAQRLFKPVFVMTEIARCV